MSSIATGRRDGPSRAWFRSPAMALAAAVGALAGAVERLAPASGATKILRESSAAGSARIRVGGKAYPRTARDGDDFVVRMARPVRSVVSQHWSIDELVYSIVPPAHVSGVSQSAYLEQISNVIDHVRKHRPVVAADPERVVRLDPDLILVASSARADFTALVRSTGVPIHRMFTAFTTLDQVAESIRLAGYLTGEDESAEKEFSRFTQAVARARSRRPPGVAPPRVLGFGGRFSYGKETLFHDVVTTLGGVNVGAEGGLRGYDNVNTEQILRWNPEWIVAGADRGKTKEHLARLMDDPAISLTQAARNGRILVFDHQVFLPASPFSTVILDVLGDALYGR